MSRRMGLTPIEAIDYWWLRLLDVLLALVFTDGKHTRHARRRRQREAGAR